MIHFMKDKGEFECFRGYEAVTILSSLCACTRPKAEAIGTWLQDNGYICHLGHALPFFDDETFYYLPPGEVEPVEDTEVGWIMLPNDPPKATSPNPLGELTLARDILPDTQYHQKFREYCVKEMNEEGLDFWDAVHVYHKMTLCDRIVEAKRLYSLFIDQTAIKPLNLTRGVVNTLEKSKPGDLEYFDAIEEHVELDMEDVLTRFKSHLISEAENEKAKLSRRRGSVTQRLSSVFRSKKEPYFDLGFVLADYELCKIFREFCNKEHSEELLEFITEVQKYKYIEYMDPKIEQAYHILNLFIETDEEFESPFQERIGRIKISTSKRLVDTLKDRITSAQDDIFDGFVNDVMRSLNEKHSRWAVQYSQEVKSKSPSKKKASLLQANK
ncbi:hypothetical protein AKO1_015716 [Acrasis kona]|uniref:RGS domain-containing protein n=1 Tax=Acrasis kona TaxID=1008807 RepID=A0AAW2ZH70_9EUKA